MARGSYGARVATIRRVPAPGAPFARRVAGGVRRRADRWLAAQGEAARLRLDPWRPHPIYLEYPPTSDASPRYGHGRPGHAAIQAWLDRERDAYAALQARFAAYGDDLATFPHVDDGTAEPPLVQQWLPGGDILVLYGLVRELAPARFVEIGSGNSTKVVARARRDGALATTITSIDPQPRAEVDALCDRVVRAPLEQAGTDAFAEVAAGDIVFIDSSHRAFTGSDVVVFFMDVLPALPPGVTVGIHDMFWPADYPQLWEDYWLNEQYLVGALLLGDPDWLEPVYPVFHAATDPGLRDGLRSVWERPELAGVDQMGSGLWLRTVDPARDRTAAS